MNHPLEQVILHPIFHTAKFRNTLAILAAVLCDSSDQKGKTQFTSDFAFNSTFNGIQSQNRVRLD